MFNTCEVAIEFEFGDVAGQYMTLEVSNNHSTTIVIPENPRYSTSISLPTKLTLTTGNKNPRYHTIIEDGKIVEDVYVKIISVTLDGQHLNENFLHKKITINADDGNSHVTSYFGFNGKVDLDFSEDNVFIQYLMLNADV